MALLEFLTRALAMAGIACLWTQFPASAQGDVPPPQGTSRGENFSAKPPAALFASDCTGAGCHKSPQGLAKGQGAGSLAGFLREHYTNSRQSAAALAGYLAGLPIGPDPREARTPRSGGPGASGPGASAPATEPRPSRSQSGAAASRATARPEDDAPTSPSAVPRRSTEPGDAPSKQSPNPRAQRGRQPTAAAAPPTEAPPAPAPPPPPPPKQFDIFD